MIRIPLLKSLRSDRPTRSAIHLTRLDLALLLAATLWGANFVVSKAAIDALAPFIYNALRFAVGVLGMAVVFRLRGIDLRLPRREWGSIVFASVISYALYQPFFINGLHLTSAGNSVLIITAGPVWVVLFNAVRREERVTRGSVVGVFIALFGVFVVIFGRYAGQVGFSTVTLEGDLLMLVGSFLWAWSVMASRKPLVQSATAPATFWMLVIGTIFQTLFAIPDLRSFSLSVINFPVLLAILYSGLISIVIGSVIFNDAIAKIGTARASVYTYVQPLVAATLAILLLGEAFTPWLVLGGAFIFVGVNLVRRA